MKKDRDELTPEQRLLVEKIEAMSFEERMAVLDAIPDEEIDTVSIPPVPPENWRYARRGPITKQDLEEMRQFFRPRKEPVTIRLDADILHWFKNHAAGGKGWQTDINRVLRQWVETHS